MQLKRSESLPRNIEMSQSETENMKSMLQWRTVNVRDSMSIRHFWHLRKRTPGYFLVLFRRKLPTIMIQIDTTHWQLKIKIIIVLVWFKLTNYCLCFIYFIDTSSHSPFFSLTGLEFTVKMKLSLNSQRCTCHSLPSIEITVYATTFIELCFEIYCLFISIFYTHKIINSY